ncbi:MAG: SGNH/GDSL hydrolase family protein [Porcipelethomonas sp.]
MIIKKFLSGIVSLAVMAVCLVLPVSAQNETAEKLKVMPLGDSITDGFWLTGGYRTTLCNLLEENGYSDQIDFVGPNWGGDCYDPNHAGYSGYSIDNIEQSQSISGARTGISSFIDWLLEEYPADVVMLQIGTNDILSYYDLDNIGTRLENLANTILNDIGNSGKLYLATIPCMDANNTLYINEYYFTPESMDDIVDSYNSQIRALVSKLKSEGKNVDLADINSVLGKEDLYDGVHPSAEGYEKMGNYWYSILTSYIDGNDVPPEDTPIKGDVNSDGRVTVSDIVLMGEYLCKKAEISSVNFSNSDVNNDLVLNVYDSILIKRILLKQ